MANGSCCCRLTIPLIQTSLLSPCFAPVAVHDFGNTTLRKTKYNLPIIQTSETVNITRELNAYIYVVLVKVFMMCDSVFKAAINVQN